MKGELNREEYYPKMEPNLDLIISVNRSVSKKLASKKINNNQR